MLNKNKLFIANWKMNFGWQASVDLASTLAKDLATNPTKVVLCPAFTSLAGVAKSIHDSSLSLGAQDVSWLDKGNLTGEVAAATLKELGVEYVIVGHSERRQYLGETEDMINKKLQAVLRSGLIPVLCVGETFAERQQERKDFVISGQVESALKDIKLNGKDLLVAYEPVWAIGSDQAVKIDEAEAAARVIKQVLIDLYPDIDVKKTVGILYGGSVDESNISEFTGSKLLSGVLVGGASLHADEIFKMVAKMNIVK